MLRAGCLTALLFAGCVADFSDLDDPSADTTANPAGPRIDRIQGARAVPTDDVDDDGLGEVTQELAPSDTNGISPHSGPVMTTVNIYYIWYGSWAGDTATTILGDLANSIGGSPYWNINTTYFGPGGTHVPSRVRLAGSTTDFYSRSAALTDSAVLLVVADAINSGRLPRDPSGVYFVLGSPDVTETSGFCSAYCGWHNQGTVSGTKIKFAFVGNAATQCPSNCMAQPTSPNGNPGADGMASVIAHELEETATDPNLDAWFDGTGLENADKCAWTFGPEYTAPNGTRANMRLGGRDFLIQQNWVNARGGYCAQAIHYDTLDGILTAAPAASSLGPGELDVFGRGTDNALWHRFYNGGWSPWELLDPTPIGSAPAAVKSSTGRIDVFARGTDGALLHKAFDHTWTAWETLGGGIIGAPAVASWGPSRLDVFVRALDSSLVHRWFDGGSWSGWENLGGILTSEPAAVSWSAGRMDVFVRALDNTLAHRWFEGGWSGWENLGDARVASAPAVASWGPGHLDVFARSPDNTLLHRGFPASIFGGWTSFESLGVTTMSAPAAVSWGSGRVDVFMTGEGSALWHAAYDGGTW